MIHDHSTSGLRDLGAESRRKIEAELHGYGDPERAPSPGIDEDATGTRIIGPMGAARLDEDALGTRAMGPMFRTIGDENAEKIAAELAGDGDGATPASTRFDEDATGTREVGPMFRELGGDAAGGTRVSGPIGAARFDEDATGTRLSGPMLG